MHRDSIRGCVTSAHKPVDVCTHVNVQQTPLVLMSRASVSFPTPPSILRRLTGAITL